MNVVHSVERGSRLFPDKPALLFESDSFTYRDLDAMSSRVANGLTGLGMARGDRIALCLPNIPAFVIALLGIYKLGAIAVAMNAALKPDEARFVLDDSGARALVTTAARRDQVAVGPRVQHVLVAEGAAHGAIALSALMASAAPHAQAVAMAERDPAVILYTSGTTGFPKGATHSHGSLLANVRASVSTFRMQPADRGLLFLPVYHNFGQNTVLTPTLEAGATLLLQRDFDLTAVLDAVVQHGITMVFGVPTIFALLYAHASPEQMRSVRLYLSAAAPLPLALSQQWQSKFGLPISEGYGLTETFLVTFNHAHQYICGSVGSPFEGIEMRIVDAHDQVLPPGACGEVVIRGPNVMLGYWNRPVETSHVLTQGWFHTGDIGYMDDHGYFYIVDRVKDMINVGGAKVYPSEVEQLLVQHPAVAEAAVYGVPHALLGEQVRASLVLKPNHGVSPAGVMAFCRQRLADFKVPSVVECVEALPKSRTGKILKRVLRAAVHTDSAARHEPAAHVVGPQDTPTRQAIEHWIVQWLAAQLACHPDTIAVGKPLAECGLTSLFAVHLAQQLGDWLGRSLAPVLVWQCPTAAALAQHLAMEQAPTGVAHSATGTEIARDEADLSRLAVDEVAALLDAEIRLAQQRKRR